MSTEPKNITAELEVVTPAAIEAIERATIDIQVATAHKYPRSMKQFLQRATDMACIDEETAESCIYVRPVGKKNGQMQYAEGLSVRMAEIVGASYGNLRVGSMIVEQTERYVVCRGFAHDLESNFASTSEVKEPTVTKEGQPFSESMRSVVAKAALSKARRDATFQVVPKSLCRPVESKARALIAGDAKSLDARRAAAVQYVQRLGIDVARVWAALGIQGEEDLTSDILLTLTGLRNAIKDKDTTIDEAFPPIIPQGNIGKPKDATSPLTATEAAAAEKQKEPKKKDPAKAPEKTEPTAEELVAQLIAKGAAINAGRSLLTGKLIELGILSDGETLTDLDTKRAALALDAWEQIHDSIIKPS